MRYLSPFTSGARYPLSPDDKKARRPTAGFLYALGAAAVEHYPQPQCAFTGAKRIHNCRKSIGAGRNAQKLALSNSRVSPNGAERGMTETTPSRLARPYLICVQEPNLTTSNGRDLNLDTI